MSSYQDTLQQGATIGCYQIEEVLGRGGFAVTYLAIDQNLDVYVAIKEYLPREITSRNADGTVTARDAEFAEDYETGLENFAREAKTLALFKHPNIVRVHQVLHENNTAYMVMDYEHGRELADVLEEQKSLSEEELRPILFPVLDAVDEIHHQGYVHRDIKPSNIYLRDDGSPVLLDFGAARYTLSETTQQLTAVVTVGYTPIEQYNVSDADQGPWTDIYALSAVLYEAVTGEMPVDSVTRASSTLTNASDPLVPVRNKSLQPCADAFYDAIDWGLQMDALERPRSIGQWVDALNGKALATTAEDRIEPPGDTTIRRPERPKRASKLRTRAKSLAAAETDSHHRTSVELAMQDFDVENYPDSRIEPSFGESITDIDVDGADVPARRDSAASDRTDQPATISGSTTAFNGSASYETESAPGFATGDARQPLPQSPEPPVLSNSAADLRHQPALTRPPVVAGKEPQSGDNSAYIGNKAPASTNGAGKTHTQEIRDVVRRDIMKRVVDSEPATDTDSRQLDRRAEDHAAGFADNSSASARKPGRILTRSHLPQADTSATDAQQNELPNRGYQQAGSFKESREDSTADAVQFDESDWDYEPPGNASKWKWIIPAAGLAAVFAASMLYVNKPELFQFNKAPIPELTINAALQQAEERVADGQFIFPPGESALDYYQLVLGSEPNNSEALAGIELIENQVRQQIVQSVEDNSLSEANRLLSRANQAGLRVDNIPSAGVGDTAQSTTQQGSTQQSSSAPGADQSTVIAATSNSQRVTAIDKDMSPYLKRRITEIEQEIENGNADAAAALFAEADQYLPNTELSSTLKQRIEAVRLAQGNQSDAATSDTTGTNEIRFEADNNDVNVASDTGAVPPVTNTLGDASSPFPNAEIPARASEFADNESVAVAESTVAAAPSINQPDVPEAGTQAVNQAVVDQPVVNRPVSAPRKSYIDGRGESARHLNQLRTAIESKNLDRVLQVSDALPAERVDFLKQMFRRYDRIDVVIDRIRNQSGELTANLNVSMFNQRNDGSFYSAGRWNGVTVRTSQVDDQWQKIEW